MKNLSIILGLLVLSIYSFSQSFTIFNTANTSTTLPHHQVNSVAFDNQGNTWFGTDWGIARNNGSAWLTINQEHCNKLVADHSGNIWYPDSYGVITKFDGTDTITFPGLSGSIEMVDVTTDQAGNIWFAGSNLVLKYDGQNWTTIVPGFYGVTCIAIDPEGQIWLGGENGVATYDGSSWFYYYTLGLSYKQRVYDIAFDEMGYAWAGYIYGVYVLRGNNANIISIPYSSLPHASSIYSVAIDAGNSKYFATKGGVKKLNGNTWSSYSTDEGLISNSVKAVRFDPNGDLWIGTDEGVSVFNGSTFTNYTNNGLKSNYVSGTYRDSQDRLWFTTNKGISVLDGCAWHTYRKTDGLAGDTVQCMATDYSGNLWFGTGTSGVSKFNETSWSNLNVNSGLPSNNVTCIISDPDNNIWIGTEMSGVCKYDGNSVRTYRQINSGLVYDVIYDMMFDDYGNLWIGTGDGISVYDGIVWKNFRRSTVFSNAYKRLAFDKDQKLWATTDYDLLSLSAGTFTKYNLPTNYLYHLQPAFDSTNTLYLSCDQNLLKFDASGWTMLGNPVTWGVDFFPHSLYIDSYGYKWKTFSYNGVTRVDDGGSGPLRSKTIIVRGIVFNDLNGNGTKEQGESGLPQQLVSYDTHVATTTNGGRFSVLSDAGNHTVTLNIPQNWQPTNDSTQYISLVNGQQPDTLFFGIKAILNIHDVSVSLTGSRTRLYNNSIYWIDYKNNGSVAESGNVEFKPDSNITILSTIPPFSSVIGNTYIWNIGNLQPGEHGQILVSGGIIPFELFGDTLISNAKFCIQPIDIHPEDNSESLAQLVTGPVDPNEKEVSPKGEGNGHKVLVGQELTYTIYFQNTGTDTATRVVIQDTISPFLDLGSFRLIASSHPATISIKRPGILSFIFDNILLPDSNINQSGSNGFVKFVIKPLKGAGENAVVLNKADIFFDNNPPVETNTVFSTLVNHINSVRESSYIKAIACPNPFSDRVKISFGNPQNDRFDLEITSLQGRIVKKIDGMVGSQVIIEGQSLPHGLCFYRLFNRRTGNVLTGKLIRN